MKIQFKPTLTIIETGCTLLRFFKIDPARSVTDSPIAQEVYPFSLIISQALRLQKVRKSNSWEVNSENTYYFSGIHFEATYESLPLSEISFKIIYQQPKEISILVSETSLFIITLIHPSLIIKVEHWGICATKDETIFIYFLLLFKSKHRI